MKAAEATRRKRFVIEHSRGKFTCGKQPLFQIWSQMVRNLATFGESARVEAMPVRCSRRSSHTGMRFLSDRSAPGVTQPQCAAGRRVAHSDTTIR